MISMCPFGCERLAQRLGWYCCHECSMSQGQNHSFNCAFRASFLQMVKDIAQRERFDELTLLREYGRLGGIVPDEG